ncbi:hypothetical protein DO021_19550 [Desulfobacter hydrogenophilus]|uniref:Transglycosylase SLT domain-containing protein n=1 Tax=Desulfobacter hydrogenophilus TaxID=2291 RepID=A0A328F728_9BACT|nr:hypothetical protein [Desulfobacter hydrogenophilus]NDY73966.1 hypothetical protein [Desulfobacter hydrogenophilus]QBH14312.1 hypothetical protein EYB58_16150 [Desulfobacter hydrogenophilus]RAM00348.1 hypothetical protein DO021_19550 [Desulfobacter hydrogenophilus]
MPFYYPQFKDLISQTLKSMELYSESAVNLLLGTAAQESGFGTYIRQIRGPARGVFQCEPATELDIWDNYLRYKLELADRILRVTGVKHPSATHLETHLDYQIALCRVHYLRVKASLPAADDIPGLAAYWKRHYNTALGAGTVDQFIDNYRKYCTTP